MTVREHLSQHEAAERLPLVTDAARMTAVEAMDENRTEAVRRALADRLRAHGEEQWVREEAGEREEGAVVLDWGPVTEFAAGAGDEALSTLLARYARPYPSLAEVRVAPDTPFSFAAGQYAALEFGGTPRPYSIANAPGADELEFCIRRVPGGRLTSALFTELDVGDEVTVRGPSGEFVLEEPSARDLVFLATGTGVAPLKSMIEFTFAAGRDRVGGVDRDVWLFLGCGWRDDLPYHERFASLDDDRENFQYVPTLSRERYLTDWRGETDYVQRTLMKYVDTDSGASLDGDLATYLDREPVHDVDARIDSANAEVYACGINAMVNTLVDAVAQLDVDERFVDAEGFG